MNTWHIKHSRADNCLILRDQNVVIGSAKFDRAAGLWRIEIFWSGPEGDYTFASNSMSACRAYVTGVEDAQQRMQRLLPGVAGS